MSSHPELAAEQAYIDYAAGRLEDHEYAEEEVALALAGLPAVAA